MPRMRAIMQLGRPVPVAGIGTGDAQRRRAGPATSAKTRRAALATAAESSAVISADISAVTSTDSEISAVISDVISAVTSAGPFRAGLVIHGQTRARVARSRHGS